MLFSHRIKASSLKSSADEFQYISLGSFSYRRNTCLFCAFPGGGFIYETDGDARRLA